MKLPAICHAASLAIKIVLATATRKGEIIHARWQHVDLDQALWTIPAANSKNAKAFVIPLPVGDATRT